MPDPARPQNYNRYTYVLGNPLSLVDPSGHCAKNTRSGDEYEEDYVCWQKYHELWTFIHKNSQRFLVPGSFWTQDGIWQELASRNAEQLDLLLGMVTQPLQEPNPSRDQAVKLWSKNNQYPGQTINAVLSPTNAADLIETLQQEADTASAIDNVSNYLEISGLGEIVDKVLAVIAPEIGVPIAQIDLQGQDLVNLIMALQVAVDNGEYVHISGGIHSWGWSIEVNGIGVISRSHFVWSGPLTILSGWIFEHRHVLAFSNKVN